jgi:hypothetical protein
LAAGRIPRPAEIVVVAVAGVTIRTEGQAATAEVVDGATGIVIATAIIVTAIVIATATTIMTTTTIES